MSKRKFKDKLHNKNRKDCVLSVRLGEPGSAARYAKGLRSNWNVLEGRHRQAIREHIADIFALGCFLKENDEAWSDFCQPRHWKSLPISPVGAVRGSEFRWALRMAVGEEVPAARISCFEGILTFLHERGTSPDAARKEILDVGVKKLDEAARDHRREKRVSAIEPEDVTEIEVSSGGSRPHLRGDCSARIRKPRLQKRTRIILEFADAGDQEDVWSKAPTTVMLIGDFIQEGRERILRVLQSSASDGMIEWLPR